MTSFWNWLFDGYRGQGLPKRAWAALLALSLLALTPGLTTIPTMDRDEARYAQASRQMMETGDYVDIRFQDQARHVKPVGIYWMQVATAMPFGGEDAPIWAHRLPSILGAVLAVFITGWLGARMGGPQIGFIAATFIALSLAIGVEARTAKTDAMLLAAIAAAQAALYFILKSGAPQKMKFWGAPAWFWAASGLGIIIKGPIITLVSGGTLLLWTLWRRDWSWLGRLRILPGLVLMAAIAAPWLIAITIQTNGAFIEQAVGHALFGKVAQSDDSHGAPTGYHTLLFFVTFWPGAVVGAFMAAYAWTKRKAELVQFLICWALPTWIVFELVVTKLPHYVTPVFPALAILSAFAVKDASRLFAMKRFKWAHYAVVGFVLLVSLLIAGLPLIAERELDAPFSTASMVAAVVGALTALAIVLYGLTPNGPRLLTVCGASVAFFIAAFHIAIPGIDRLWLSDRLSDKVALVEGCEAIPFATAGYREPSNVFHFGTDTLLGPDGAAAANHLAAHPECGLVAVAQTDTELFNARLDEIGVETRTLGKVSGVNYVKGDDLTLTLYTLYGSLLNIQVP